MKSLMLLVVLYPLLQPIWEKEPFNTKNTELPSAVTYLDEEKITEQKSYFLKNTDPRIRSGIVKSLSESNNPKVLKVLFELLKKENDDSVKEDILIGLYSLDTKIGIKKTAELKDFFKHDSPGIRAYSCALYLHETGKAEEILKLLETEKSLFVQNFLWKELAKKPELCNKGSLEAHIKSGEPARKKGAAFILAGSQGNVGAMYPSLTDIASGDDMSAKLALASALSKKQKGSEELLEKLSNDKSATIRGLAASAPSRSKRKEIHIKLAGDKDWEVRRLACISLGGYTSDDVINTLIKHLEDNSKQVRTAAEDSLVKIKPGNEAIEKIAECLDKKTSKDSAIRVLGLLKKKQYADKIVEILNDDASGTETIIRSIYALGRLRHKKACSDIMSKASSEDIPVRQAVAVALGQLAEKKSFNTLVELSDDKKQDVSLAAVESMGIIGDSFFNKRLYKIITSYGMNTPADMRGAACWSLARIDAPDKKILDALETLALNQVIKIEMGVMYDSDFVRAAICFALIDMGRTDPAAEKLAKRIIKLLKGESEAVFETADFTNHALKDFANQAELYMNKKKAKSGELPFIKPDMTIIKIEKN